MATVTRQFTFVDTVGLSSARADQWMSDANLLRTFVVNNVQDVDGSSQYTAAPVLSGGDPASANQAVRKAYQDTKLKLEDVLAGDLTYPDPGTSNKSYFWQGGKQTVTTVLYPSIEVFYITFPVAYHTNCTPMVWFCLAETGAAELYDNYVTNRTPTNFAGWIATGTARTVSIAWVALGFDLITWNDIDL